jgi:AAA domain, putative AbiEii toxin, Type IV TA system
LESDKPEARYASLYFGGGLHDILNKASISADGKAYPVSRLSKPGGRTKQDETVLVIPAQRVSVLQDGWPKPFMAYLSGDPYCMRRFSELLRKIMDDFDPEAPVVPQPRRLMSTLREQVDAAIYGGFELRLELEGSRRHLVLARPSSKTGLPINAWSAGQREFTPLLFSMYWLLPPAKVNRRGDIEHVVIEEPEMGLHPKAIVSLMLLVLALLHRGYRVTVSTHSPVVLDVAWAILNLKEVPTKQAVRTLRQIFEIQAGDNQINASLQSALEKKFCTYYFERAKAGVEVRSISTLDPGDEDQAVSGWGGLSGFSGHIADLVGAARTKAEIS